MPPENASQQIPTQIATAPRVQTDGHSRVNPSVYLRPIAHPTSSRPAAKRMSHAMRNPETFRRRQSGHSRGHNGGGSSHQRTCLSHQFPANREKNRELIFRIRELKSRNRDDLWPLPLCPMPYANTTSEAPMSSCWSKGDTIYAPALGLRLALRGSAGRDLRCPLRGLKQTSSSRDALSDDDSEQTFGATRWGPLSTRGRRVAPRTACR